MTQHAPRFDQSTVYFNFCLAGSEPIDIHRFASRLLKSGLAEMVGSPTEDEIHLSPRYAGLEKAIREFERLENVARTLSEPLPHPWRWALRHPRLVFGALRKRPAGTRSSAPPDPESTQGFPDLAEWLSNNATELRHAVARAQLNNAVIHNIESDIYGPSYLGQNAYLRLNLRETIHWFTTKGDGSERNLDDWDEGVIIEAMLMVHRSGVLQLLIVARLPDNLNTGRLIELCLAKTPCLAASEMPEVLLRLATKPQKGGEESHWLGEWQSEIKAGERWRRFSHPGEPGTISQLADLYIDAMSVATRTKLSHRWISYPTLFVDRTTCCPSEEAWKAAHTHDLGRLISRMASPRLRTGVLDHFIPPDRSITVTDSFYLTIGMATVINWEPDHVPDFSDHLQRYLIIEIALLRYWQLVALHERLGRTLNRRRINVRDIQIQTINSFQEWRQSPLTYGTAREIVDALLRELEADRMHENLNESMQQLQQMQAADDSKRSSARATVLAFAGLIAAIVLGLPAINDALNLAAKTNNESFTGHIAAPLRAIAKHGVAGTWALFLSVIAVVIVLMGVAIWHPRRRSLNPNRGHRRMPGLRWPWGTIPIVRVSRDDVAITDKREPTGEFGGG